MAGVWCTGNAIAFAIDEGENCKYRKTDNGTVEGAKHMVIPKRISDHFAVETTHMPRLLGDTINETQQVEDIR